MTKRKRDNWWLPGWAFKAQKKKARFAAVRRRDGDLCWVCGCPMVFDEDEARRAATIEHVVPLSKGGTWALDNLRLCHKGCNRHLADRDPEQKERMRQPLARKLFAR